MAGNKGLLEKVGLTRLAAALATIIVAMWLIIVVMMWLRISTADETAWGRMASIMTAVQALAFAAAGALFGVKVEEKKTDKAKADAGEGGKLAKMVQDMKMPAGAGQTQLRHDDPDWQAVQKQADRVLTRLSL